jgi:hypothetical protein
MSGLPASHSEGITWYPRCTIAKYSADQVNWARGRLGGGAGIMHGSWLRAVFTSPEDGTVHDEGNGVVAGGLANLALLLTGEGGHPLAPGRACFGVGTDGATKFSPELAHLSHAAGEADGASFYQPMDPGFPRARGTVIECQATFAEADACFTWAEWGVAVGRGKPRPGPVLRRCFDDGAVLVNRRAAAAGYGTKEFGVAWVFSVAIQLKPG